MGKKRSHAETKDGFQKPSPDQPWVTANSGKKDKKKDKKDRRNGDVAKQKPNLVCGMSGGVWMLYADSYIAI
jgi:ribosome biogenesis protein MAK21